MCFSLGETKRSFYYTVVIKTCCIQLKSGEHNAIFFEHNFKHNTRFFWVTLKSIILEFSSIMYLTLTLEAMAKQLEESVKKYTYEISAETYSPVGQLFIMNHGNRPLRIDRDLDIFLDIGHELKKEIIIVKQIKRPTSYFIHCDLINKVFNFVNNKKSNLLAKIDVKGRPYEKVRYDASPQQPIRDCSTSSHVNSITISVRDQDGELFDFKDMTLEFELELNLFSIYNMC